MPVEQGGVDGAPAGLAAPGVSPSRRAWRSRRRWRHEGRQPHPRRGAPRPRRHTARASASYVVLGVLALVVAMSAAYTLANQLADRQARRARRGSRSAPRPTRPRPRPWRATRTSPALREKRSETVRSLATSRFDWSTTLHEVARDDPVRRLADLDARHGLAEHVRRRRRQRSAALGRSPGRRSRSSAAPTSQDKVARCDPSLRRIDGVQRVSLSSSAKGDRQLRRQRRRRSGGAATPHGRLPLTAATRYPAVLDDRSSFDPAVRRTASTAVQGDDAVTARDRLVIVVGARGRRAGRLLVPRPRRPSARTPPTCRRRSTRRSSASTAAAADGRRRHAGQGPLRQRLRRGRALGKAVPKRRRRPVADRTSCRAPRTTRGSTSARSSSRPPAARGPPPTTPAASTPAAVNNAAGGARRRATRPARPSSSSSTHARDQRAGRRATQAAAATLPPGATVGAAGFPTMPFTFVFNGRFFDMETFLARVNRLRARRRQARRRPRPPADRRRLLAEGRRPAASRGRGQHQRHGLPAAARRQAPPTARRRRSAAPARDSRRRGDTVVDRRADVGGRPMTALRDFCATSSRAAVAGRRAAPRGRSSPCRSFSGARRTAEPHGAHCRRWPDQHAADKASRRRGHARGPGRHRHDRRGPRPVQAAARPQGPRRLPAPQDGPAVRRAATPSTTHRAARDGSAPSHGHDRLGHRQDHQAQAEA